MQVHGLGFADTPTTCQASPSTSLAAKWPLKTQDRFWSRRGSVSCPALSLQALVRAGTPGEDSLVDAGAAGGEGGCSRLVCRIPGITGAGVGSPCPTQPHDNSTPRQTRGSTIPAEMLACPVHFQVSQSQRGVWDHHRHHTPKGGCAAQAGLRGWGRTTAPGLDQSRAAMSVSKLTRTIRILQVIQGFLWDPDLFVTR